MKKKHVEISPEMVSAAREKARRRLCCPSCKKDQALMHRVYLGVRLSEECVFLLLRRAYEPRIQVLKTPAAKSA